MSPTINYLTFKKEKKSGTIVLINRYSFFPGDSYTVHSVILNHCQEMWNFSSVLWFNSFFVNLKYLSPFFGFVWNKPFPPMRNKSELLSFFFEMWFFFSPPSFPPTCKISIFGLWQRNHCRKSSFLKWWQRQILFLCRKQEHLKTDFFVLCRRKLEFSTS